MEFGISRSPVTLAYGIGLLLGYAPQTVSGDADTILYGLTVLCAIVFFAGDAQDWTESDRGE
jgi:hypothetical protein